MAKKPGNKIQVRPLEERLRIAREINEYRAAHIGMRAEEVFKVFGVKASNYYHYNQVLKVHELQQQRKANGEAHHKVEEFPLAIIPDRPAKRAPGRPRAVVLRAEPERSEDLAAQLLEVVAKILRQSR